MQLVKVDIANTATAATVIFLMIFFIRFILKILSFEFFRFPLHILNPLLLKQFLQQRVERDFLGEDLLKIVDIDTLLLH